MPSILPTTQRAANAAGTGRGAAGPCGTGACPRQPVPVAPHRAPCHKAHQEVAFPAGLRMVARAASSETSTPHAADPVMRLHRTRTRSRHGASSWSRGSCNESCCSSSTHGQRCCAAEQDWEAQGYSTTSTSSSLMSAGQLLAVSATLGWLSAGGLAARAAEEASSSTAAAAESAAAAAGGAVSELGLSAAELAAAGVSTVVPAGYVPSPVEVGWEVWVGFVAGVVPFVIGAYEFGKRIIIQLRCEVCGGRGLVPSAGAGRDKYLRKCPQCGGFFPWISWKMFLSSTAAPGNGGPLQQPKGQTSVLYSVPDSPDPTRQAEARARTQAVIDAMQARKSSELGTAAAAAAAAEGDAGQQGAPAGAAEVRAGAGAKGSQDA